MLVVTTQVVVNELSGSNKVVIKESYLNCHGDIGVVKETSNYHQFVNYSTAYGTESLLS